uniref:AAA family ATPase n=1 Tax=Salinibacter altiplanensis TaxID=1803181 RepID=UPI001319E965
MIKELRCQNYKAFGEETQFPLSDLTVIVGPNNAGKSTALDLVRLTKKGHGLNLTSGRGRLRTFENLLNGSEGDSLVVGRRISADITLRPSGSDAPTFHLADDVSFESEFVPFGDGFWLKRRDLFMHPRDEESKQKVASKKLDVGPAESVDSTPSQSHDDIFDILLGEESESESEKESVAPPPEELWFGLPWNEQSDRIRRKEPTDRRSGYRTPPSGPYKRQVSKEYVIDGSLVDLALGIANAIRRHVHKEPPIDLSAGPLRFHEKSTPTVHSKDEPPPPRAYPLDFVIEERLGYSTPEWIP